MAIRCGTEEEKSKLKFKLLALLLKPNNDDPIISFNIYVRK